VQAKLSDSIAESLVERFVSDFWPEQVKALENIITPKPYVTDQAHEAAWMIALINSHDKIVRQVDSFNHLILLVMAKHVYRIVRTPLGEGFLVQAHDGSDLSMGYLDFNG
jgi:hypothetical protein